MTKTFLSTLAGVIAGAVLLTASGCDGYLDINDDPNNPTDVPVAPLLASTTFSTGSIVYGLGDVSAHYVQYLASPNRASASDTYETISLGNTWGNIYDNLADLRAIQTKGTAEGATDYVGIAQILEAFHLASAVDMWGDVPYSTALDPSTTLSPTYDDGRELYTTALQLLDTGIASLEAGGSSITPGGDDFIYQGDTDLWIQAGYALKARYLNHLSETAQYDAGAVLAAVDKAFTSSAGDMSVEFGDTQRNPWNNAAIRNSNLLLDGWLSDQIVQALDGTTYGVADPRIEAYTDALVLDSVVVRPYIGTRNGAGRGDAKESGQRNVLTQNTYYAKPGGSLEVITYPELKMIEAEAALRGSQPGRAYTAYLEAIRSHMATLGVASEDAEAYIAAPQVGVGAGALGLDDIFREKYKVMFLNPEAWVDARRYDYAYQGFQLPANSVLSTFIRRLDYPDTEYTRNGANVPAGVSLTDPVWWDQ